MGGSFLNTMEGKSFSHRVREFHEEGVYCIFLGSVPFRAFCSPISAKCRGTILSHWCRERQTRCFWPSTIISGAMKVHGHGAGDWRERKMVSSVLLTSDDADVRSFPPLYLRPLWAAPLVRPNFVPLASGFGSGSPHGQLFLPEC
jgi:hypothetical protein